MDSSETPMDTQSSAATKQITGPTNVAPSVIVSLHPLVVMNIAEHWTRVRAQIGNKVQGIMILNATMRHLKRIQIEFHIKKYIVW